MNGRQKLSSRSFITFPARKSGKARMDGSADTYTYTSAVTDSILAAFTACTDSHSAASEDGTSGRLTWGNG